MTDPDLASDTNSRLLWLFLILAIPVMIAMAFWLNGYLG